jgi:hypothetical protein
VAGVWLPFDDVGVGNGTMAVLPVVGGDVIFMPPCLFLSG